MGKQKFDQEPAEGSRETVERDLAQHENPMNQRKSTPHPAGPHATEEATNSEATPGAGALPAVKPTDEIESGTG